MKIIDKIMLALYVCEGEHKDKYDYIYPFTTENINGYIDDFSLKDKSVLTVGSSGDQVLNAILYGANDITFIDVCPFAREYLYLKMALMLSLNREEYLKFLCYRGYNATLFKNHKTFSTITFYDEIVDCLNELDDESYYFWRELYKKYSGLILRKKLFSRDEPSRNVLPRINPYLMSDTDYNKLKDRILDVSKKINYVNDDIFKYEFNRKFDNINLSNLGTCYKLHDFLNLVDKMDNNLNDDGKMLISYLYDTDEALYDNKMGIYNVDRVLPRLPSGSQMTSFVGINGYTVNSAKIRDSVITYRKIKKM